MIAAIPYLEQIELSATGYSPTFVGPDPYGPGKGIWLAGVGQANLGDGTLLPGPISWPDFLGADIMSAVWRSVSVRFR